MWQGCGVIPVAHAHAWPLPLLEPRPKSFGAVLEDEHQQNPKHDDLEAATRANEPGQPFLELVVEDAHHFDRHRLRLQRQSRVVLDRRRKSRSLARVREPHHQGGIGDPAEGLHENLAIGPDFTIKATTPRLELSDHLPVAAPKTQGLAQGHILKLTGARLPHDDLVRTRPKPASFYELYLSA